MRSRLLPDVPTVDEAGSVQWYETSAMHGTRAPARTQDEVVCRLNAEIMKLLRDPGFSQKLEEKGLDSVTLGTPGKMAGYLKAQLPKWGRMVKETGARGD